MTGRWRAARRLFADVWTQQRTLLIRSCLLMIGGALTEGFGILTLVPLLSVVAGSGHRLPLLGNATEALGRTGAFSFALLLFLLAMAARAWILAARDILTARLQAEYEAGLKLRATATVASRGWAEAARIGQAGMQMLVANEVTRTSLAVYNGLTVAAAGALVLVQLIVAALLSLPMALAALAGLMIVLPATIRLARRSQTSGIVTLVQQEESARAGFALYAGLKAALAQGIAGEFIEDYRARLDRLAAHTVDYSAMIALSRARHSAGAALGAVALFAIGFGLLELDLPRLLAVLVLFARMSGPAQLIQQSAAGLAAFSPAFSAIEDRVGALGAGSVMRSPIALPLDWQTLMLDGLCYRYDAGGPQIGPINLRLRRGEWIAVTGASGAGKTTLIDLISGLIKATDGRILVDGAVLDMNLLKRWRAGLAYVGQQEWVGETTLRAALPHASESALWASLNIVGLAETVREWPDGLGTVLSDRGARLSGGERQRLLIARALLRLPNLLILDEATAALDLAAESGLVERLREFRPDLAVIMVAHRRETIALCDNSIRVAE